MRKAHRTRLTLTVSLADRDCFPTREHGEQQEGWCPRLEAKTAWGEGLSGGSRGHADPSTFILVDGGARDR